MTRSLALPRPAIIALAAITALSVILRFWDLAGTPPGFHYDEAFEGLEAWRILTQPGYHPIFFPGNFGVEPMFIYLTSLAFRLFGPSPAVMRGVAALVGSLTVPATYLLGTELVRAEPRIPRGLPLLAALALATLRWHILFSRVGIEPVLVPFFLVMILASLWWGLRTNRTAAWLTLGIATGLTPYTYPAGRLLPILLAALVAWIALTERRRLAGRGRGLVLAAALAVVVIAPLAWHFAHHLDELTLRTTQVAARPAATAAARPAANLLAVARMFSLRGDADPRSNVPGLPVLDLASGFPFYLGLAYLIWHWRRPALSGLLLAFAAMLAPTILSDYAPHFRRALGATPLVALFVGLGLACLLHWAGALRDRLAGSWTGEPAAIGKAMAGLCRPVAGLAVAVIVAASAYASVQAYFGRWGQDPRLFYAYDQGLWEIGRYVQGLPAEEKLYLSPRPAGDMTLAFAWRDGPEVRRFDGRHALVAPVSAGDGRPATYIIIEHEDDRGSRLLRQVYPQAEEVHTFLDRRGQVYARAFHVADPGHASRAPAHPLAAAWAEVALAGYDIDRPAFRPGDTIYLQLWWRSQTRAKADWTVFIHLLGAGHTGADGNPTAVWAGQDDRPGAGSASMLTWVPGDLVLDEHLIHIPHETPPGSYRLEVGLYDLASGGTRARLRQPGDADAIELGTVEIN